ncbi:TetR/AcrR family transcriptional regulator [Actibacterium sp. 188UL27-1]|uniref:TetR/AcrR family transcriptional regulator n=1 Tax=Actibacterium sp. 188UL27-1 TaxID=2786961 RepID=UPI001EF4EA39|nr:TetR/AcrR family transcriptional regulator [Actibacterium sp. 188UL27-1]
MYRIMEKTEKSKKRESYHHGDLRAQLIEATRVLVEDKGPDHFSVSEACREAGVSTAAPYRHFKHKDEMLLAVTKEGMDRKYQRMVAAVEQHPEGSLERIVALGQVYVGFARDEPGVFRLIFGNTRDHKMHEGLMEDGPRHYGFVEGEVAAFLGRGGVDEDAKERAFMLWTFVHGLSFLLIDEKVSSTDHSFDLDRLLLQVARRVMIDSA